MKVVATVIVIACCVCLAVVWYVCILDWYRRTKTAARLLREKYVLDMEAMNACRAMVHEVLRSQVVSAGKQKLPWDD